MTSAADPLLRFRPAFPILESTSDLISELDRAFEVFDEVRKSGAWRRWRSAPTLVT